MPDSNGQEKVQPQSTDEADFGEYITDAENNPFEGSDTSSDDKFKEFLKKTLARKAVDANELEKLRDKVKELEKEVAKDGLTQLFDMQKAAAQEVAFGKIKQAERTKTPVVMLWFDLDRFKSINDNFGHGVGDEVLKAFARSLDSAVRDEDLPFIDAPSEISGHKEIGKEHTEGGISSISDEVGDWLAFRSGGEEFGVLLFGTKIDDVPTVVRRIQKDFHFDIKDLRNSDDRARELWEVTFSCGASPFKTESKQRDGHDVKVYEDYVSVKQRADELMYAAKRDGRNRLLVERDRSPGYSTFFF